MRILTSLFGGVCCLAGLGLDTTNGRNLAGTGVTGDTGDGGPGSRAMVREPFDLVYDAAGNLFFSDPAAQKIRRIDAGTASISTVAGTGEKGFSGDGGPATSATLDEPYGLAFDAAGNLYFADRLNRRVRRVDATSRIITTVAGDGSKGFSGDGGPAPDAGLAEPNGVAIDGKGRLYIADVADHRVRVVDPATGIITTFAGDGRGRHSGDGGLARLASIQGARAVEVGPDGTVFILERQGNRLRVVDPTSGLITTRAGVARPGYSGDGGLATEAAFNGPKELAIDREGNILVVDTENHAIRRIDARTGRISTLVGDGKSPDNGHDRASTTRLDRPHGVAIGPDGSIVVGDTNNHRVRAFRPR